MVVLSMCLFTWTYIEWRYTDQLSQFKKRYWSLFILCRLWGRCLAHRLTGEN